MDADAILARIEYKRGVLVSVGEKGEELEAAAQVIRFERGRLLVRVDDESGDSIRLGGMVELEVPAAESLYWLKGRIAEISRASDGAPIVSLSIDEVEAIQRRKQERHAVSIPCRVGLMAEGESPLDPLTDPLGPGKITDISLGGAEFESELELKRNSAVKLQTVVADGRLDLPGTIVRVQATPSGEYRYGVRFGPMDPVSQSRLNRLILRLERAVRRKEWAAALGLGEDADLSRAARRRESRRRWGRYK